MGIKNTILEDIGAEIGYTATSTLCGWYGGKKLSIPLNPTPEHKIAKVIGQPAFVRLVSAFGGEYIFIPKDRAQKLTRRNRIVYDMIVRGASTSEVAARIHISNMHVTNIRGGLEADQILPLILTTPPENDDAG